MNWEVTNARKKRFGTVLKITSLLRAFQTLRSTSAIGDTITKRSLSHDGAPTMARMLTYRRAQSHCGLKVGDWVEIVAPARDFAGGWREQWTPQMSQMLGSAWQIQAIDPDSGYLLGEWFFPYFSLTKLNGN